VILSKKQPAGPLWNKDSMKIKFDLVSFTQVEAWRALRLVWQKANLYDEVKNTYIVRFKFRNDADFEKIPLKAAWIPVTFTLRNTTLKNVCDELSRKTGWRFYYDNEKQLFVFDMNSAYKDKMVNGKLPDYIYRRGW
jgi:hypothetical protein